jgi:hypothetical protein
MPAFTKSPFKALMPHESVVILLLVENSSTMSNVWNEVRQYYLAPLGEMLQFSKEDSSASVCCTSYGSDVRFSRITLLPKMTTILLESMSTESGSRLGALPRRYSSYGRALGSVKFCPHPGNVITTEMINRGIDVGNDIQSHRIPLNHQRVDTVFGSNVRTSIHSPLCYGVRQLYLQQRLAAGCAQSSAVLGQAGSTTEGGNTRSQHIRRIRRCHRVLTQPLFGRPVFDAIWSIDQIKTWVDWRRFLTLL